MKPENEWFSVGTTSERRILLECWGMGCCSSLCHGVEMGETEAELEHFSSKEIVFFLVVSVNFSLSSLEGIHDT